MRWCAKVFVQSVLYVVAEVRTLFSKCRRHRAAKKRVNRFRIPRVGKGRACRKSVYSVSAAILYICTFSAHLPTIFWRTGINSDITCRLVICTRGKRIHFTSLLTTSSVNFRRGNIILALIVFEPTVSRNPRSLLLWKPLFPIFNNFISHSLFWNGYLRTHRAWFNLYSLIRVYWHRRDSTAAAVASTQNQFRAICAAPYYKRASPLNYRRLEVPGTHGSTYRMKKYPIPLSSR